MRTKNEVMAQGRIRMSRKTESGRTLFVLEMHEKNREATVRFIYNGDLPDSIGRRDKVVVKGFVVSYSTRDSESGKWRNVQYFVAEEIKKAKSAIEEEWGLRGNFYQPDFFVGKFAGSVSRVIRTDNPNWAKLIVMVDADHLSRQASFVTFSYLTTSRLPSIDGIHVGDPVYVISSINTPHKQNSDGSDVVFENLIVEDCAKGRIPIEDKVG